MNEKMLEQMWMGLGTNEMMDLTEHSIPRGMWPTDL